jgi:peptidoglycan/LPS O-acetylase OafA/YrhL
LKHRTDIDGLRGLAVLVVFAHHLRLAGFSGGFVGVDVFFVVSGFVIARVVAERQRAGTFSLIDFWERRTRRLTPALLTVLAATTVMALIHMFPAALKTFAGSVLATLGFASNIYFWRTTDYFAAPPDDHPLLHTWSLGVEEQFYIAFPLVMLAAWRWFPGRQRLVLAGLAALSFAVGVWLAARSPVFSFYLPFGRAWELLVGVLLATGGIPVPSDRRIRAGLGIAGLGLIVGAVVLLQPWTPMPGWAALAPCLGALMLLAAGEDTPTGRLLGLAPLRFFGAISYSLYLWHWPLISYQRMLLGPDAGGWLGPVAVFAVATLLAWLSLRFIETPIRTRRDGLSTPKFYLAALAAALLVGAPAVVILATNGLPGRFGPEVWKIAESGQRAPRRDEACLPPPDGPLKTWTAACLTPDPARPNWLLVGDSHANHLWYGLSQARPGVNLMQATASNCRMTPTPHPSASVQCRRLILNLYGDLLINRPPRRVVLAGLWRTEDEAAVAEALDWYRAHRIPVVMIGPAPVYEQPVPELLALARHLSDPALPGRRRGHEADAADQAMARIARERGAPYVSIMTRLCPAGACRTTAPDGRPMEFDRGHFSRSGSLWIGAQLARDPALN